MVPNLDRKCPSKIREKVIRAGFSIPKGFDRIGGTSKPAREQL
jgi:hypothetical protein